MKTPNFDGQESEEVDSKSTSANKYILEQTAKILRMSWIDEMVKYETRISGRKVQYSPGPRIDGGYGSNGHRYPSCWDRLAKYVVKKGYDPNKFIKAQFYNLKGKAPPSPVVFMSTRGESKYADYINSINPVKDLKILIDSQLRLARSHLEMNKMLYSDTKTAYRSIILDDNVPISALVRYLIANNSGNLDLAKLYFKAAFVQYYYDAEEYEAVLGDLLPDEIKSAYTELRKGI